VHGVHANSWMARPSHLPEIQMEETWFTSQAMERIEKRDPERPFFICLSYNGGHPPLCPPEYFFNLFMNKQIPQPVVGDWAEKYASGPSYPLDVTSYCGKLSPELNHRARAAYYGFMAYVDSQIGRFIEFLGRRGLFHN